MRIAILGFDRQGRSAFEYWQSADNTIVVCDKNPDVQVPTGVETRLGSDYLEDLATFDLLVRTPGLHPKDIVTANPDNPDILDTVTTVTNEFLRICPTQNVIGVTGTKGKGTTSTLIANILATAGHRVHLGGNIGIPPLELLHGTGLLHQEEKTEASANIQPNDWVVLELANYQLIDIKYSPKIAICLMITSEHLDWHTDFDEYIQSKQQLFVHQKTDDTAIYYAKNDDSRRTASCSPGNKIGYMDNEGAHIADDQVMIDGKTICTVHDIRLIGRHNWQNVCAAITAVWGITQDTEAIKQVVRTFSGLEHRLEHVAEIDGVNYYDDSFSTAPESTIVALETFTQPKVLIIGGSDKGALYDTLAQVVKANNVRSVIYIGKTGPTIAQTLRTAGFMDIVDGGDSIERIVQTARENAKPGDIVLLSPSCASFDMFKDYHERGTLFKQSVKALAPIA
ncbi:UDP-N-acetylmuramoyl-L-alanine--D-glutamate ligase [soil metagenome]